MSNTDSIQQQIAQIGNILELILDSLGDLHRKIDEMIVIQQIANVPSSHIQTECENNSEDENNAEE